MQIFAGMKLSEAQAACAELLVVPYDEHLYLAAQKKLTYTLLAVSPKVSSADAGVFLLDATGLAYLGGEHRFCRDTARTIAAAGFPEVRLGIADTAYAASVASRSKRRQSYLVPHGDDVRFLAPLPIGYLPAKEETIAALQELGIKTIGQFTQLTPKDVGERFGADGSKAWQLAAGCDSRQPTTPVKEREFKAEIELSWPIELLGEAQFVLKSLVDRLTYDLKRHGYRAEELLLRFYNSSELFDERPIKLISASHHAKFLLEVIKLSLEAKPLGREFTGVAVIASRFGKESWEQTNIDSITIVPPGTGTADNISGQAPASEHEPGSGSLLLMLQRFMSRLGQDTVVRSVPSDQHMPDKAGVWAPLTGGQSDAVVLPINIEYVNSYTSAAGLACGLVLRKSEQPAPVLVELGGHLPTAVVYQGRWHHVKEITEPERLSGLWWERRVNKSYYIALIEPRETAQRHSHLSLVQASDSARQVSADIERSFLVLLVHNHDNQSWSVEGFFD